MSETGGTDNADEYEAAEPLTVEIDSESSLQASKPPGDRQYFEEGRPTKDDASP